MSDNEQGDNKTLPDDLIHRIGKLTRMLRDNMREIGLDKEIEKVAVAIPDTRDRLNYIATMTEQAADRALNAIDRAQPLQDELIERARALDERWAAWFDAPKELDEAKALVEQTRGYLRDVPDIAAATNKELLEIMMAQDFQDLTGQVIKKMMDIIRDIEQQLVQVLIDNVQDGPTRENLQRKALEQEERDGAHRKQTLLNGPQIKEDAPDIVTGQDQVDDLLDELGF